MLQVVMRVGGSCKGSGAASGKCRRAGSQVDLTGGHGDSIACAEALRRGTACHVGPNDIDEDGGVHSQRSNE